MVVDGEQRELRSLSGVLEGLDARVIVVQSPRDALAHPARFDCGFAIAFHLGEQPSAVELLAHLRADGACGPALLVMRDGSNEVASEAAVYGAACCEQGSAHYFGALRSLVDAHRRARTHPRDVLAWLALTLGLTPTEYRTVSVYLQGVSTREGVAGVLERSENTVKETTSHILAKATAVGLADDTIPALLLDGYRQVAGRLATGTEM